MFWGCQSSAPFYWTGGAFLRQDWLAAVGVSICMLKRRRFATAGVLIAYAFMVIGSFE